MKSIVLSILVTCTLVVATTTTNACPACKGGYAAGSKQAAVGEAYSISILFMLGLPITVVSVAGFAYYRQMKRIERK